MDSSSSLNILHISDFHVGQDGASTLWDQIREQFRTDIKKHLNRNGDLDLVIFSGDLTQRGSSDEFSLVKNELNQLWQYFNSIQQNPKLFIVPGNHDLVRPKSNATVLTGIDSFRKRESVKKAFIYDDTSEYRIGLQQAFAPYMNFLTELSQSKIPLLLDSHGSIPGDCSATITKNEFTFGFIGINTAWSQLEGGDFFEKLEITSHQLARAIEEDFSSWAENNHYNFLVTHHPKNWLSPAAIIEFENEISPLGRFDGHFFGHMHQIRSSSIGMGGALRNRTYQAASLFSLEKDSSGSVDRRHGYSFLTIDAAQESMHFWPRKASLISGGGWRIQADEFALEETDTTSNTESLPIRNSFDRKKKIFSLLANLYR